MPGGHKVRCPECGAPVRIYRNPLLAVDIIIELPGKRIMLIERKNPPHGWALPGGFVDYGESLEAAAMREALEETGLSLVGMKQFHAYSEPDRDPRAHTVSVVFIGKGEGTPKAADDAARLEVFALDNLPDDLAFDHARILSDYSEYLANKL
jgi:ADP-ribose pyrophosphatase YjhB (NUDIX family)